MKKNISQKKVVFNLPENKKFSQYKKHSLITKSEIIEKKSNIGIRTGKINNITVIDIDTKDNGLKLYESWLEDPQKAESLKPVWKERTPSGGFHLYFNYDSSLKNLIKINGFGIDIKNDNGYVVHNGSSINGKKYSYIEGDLGFDIPEWLLNFIFKYKQDYQNNNIIKHTSTINIRDEDFIDLINNLKKDKKNYSMQNYLWIKHSTFLKLYNKFDLWNDWCKADKKKYDYTNNIKIWNSLDTSKIDIMFSFNYCKMKIAFFKDFELLEDCTIDKTINERYLDAKLFDYSDSLIIKSATGTGKTTSFINYVKKNNAPFIIITTRQTMASNLYDTCLSHNLDVKLYSKDKFKEGDDLIIQLDSIRKIESWSDKFKNYTIFLDEVNSLISYLNLSTTLKNKRLDCFVILNRLIKKCKKLISVDADITFASYNFIKTLRPATKFILNEKKAWEGINVQFVTEQKILEIIAKDKGAKHICMDSKKLANAYSEKLKDDLDNIVVYDSDSKNIENPAEWTDNVIFSPKITYAVDVNTKPKNIYGIFKNVTINPDSMYQMLTRSRQVKNIYICFKSSVSHLPKYNSKTHLEKDLLTKVSVYKDILREHNIIYDEDTDEYKVIKDTFFNSLVDTLFINNLFFTNKKIWLMKILKQAGFNIITDEKNIKNFKFTDILKQIKDYNKDNYVFDEQNNLIKILNLDKSNYKLYIDYLVDKNKITSHFNLSKHFRSLDKLKKNIQHSNEFDAINSTSINVKLLLKSDFDTEANINIKNFDQYNQENVKINKNTLEKINKIFNESFDINKKYLTNSEVKTIFIKMQNKMFGKEIFNKKRSRKNGQDKTEYSINQEYLNENLNLFNTRYDE